MTKKPGLKARSQSIKAAMAAAQAGQPVDAEQAADDQAQTAAPAPAARSGRDKETIFAPSLMPSAAEDMRVLDERAELYARPPKSKRTQHGEAAFVRVRLGGGDVYGIPFSHADEVLSAAGEITPVPGTPAFVYGVINLRGFLLTVIDLAAFLGVGSVTVDDEARIVVVSTGDMRFGALVSRVDDSISADFADLAPPLAGKGRDDAGAFVKGIHQGVVAVLDIDALAASPALNVNHGGVK